MVLSGMGTELLTERFLWQDKHSLYCLYSRNLSVICRQLYRQARLAERGLRLLDHVPFPLEAERRAFAAACHPAYARHFPAALEELEVLKISRRTLQEYRTARIIPYYLIQGKVLYMESEIQKLLEDSRKKCIGGQEWV